MSAAYVVCKVFPGLFENEFYVTVNGTSAYYVNRQSVKAHGEPTAESPVDGRVLGYVVEQEHGRKLIQMPGEAVIGGVRTWVEDEYVLTA